MTHYSVLKELNRVFVLLCCISILGVLEVSSQSHLPLQSLDGITIDERSCATAQESQNLSLLERNIVAYYGTTGNKIKTVTVRLVCDYNESGMRQMNYPSMSTRKFKRVLNSLDNNQPIGKRLKDGSVEVVNAGFIRHIRRYEKAVVSWDEFSCDTAEKSRFGCGIFRIDVAYLK